MEWFNELLDAMVTGAVSNGWVLQHSSELDCSCAGLKALLELLWVSMFNKKIVA